MKKSMGIVLIVVGIILTMVGIVMLSGNKKSEEQTVTLPSKPKNVVSTPSVDSISKTDENPSDTVSKQIPVITEDRIAEQKKPNMTSKEKGDEFEDFTVNLLADRRMKLLRRTQDKMSSGGVVAESCKEPDLHIEQKRGNSKVDYHLECKYRSRWTDNAVTFEEWQLKRYREFQKTSKRKVLIALGVGGSPSKPQTFMIVPLDSIKDNAIRMLDVSKYAVSPTSDGLVAYIDHYFDEVFASARNKRKEN